MMMIKTDKVDKEFIIVKGKEEQILRNRTTDKVVKLSQRLVMIVVTGFLFIFYYYSRLFPKSYYN
jgi:hypothetical protein